MSRSADLYSDALNYMPAGVNSPVRAFRSVGGTPLYMNKGQGSRLTDEDGTEYIDFCMSWGPLLLGHADPEVTQAVVETAAMGTSFGTPHRYEIDLARRVTESFPGMEKVRFVNSGTEATMSAIRLARGVTKKDKIVKFDGCYHGHADYLLVAAGSGLATFGTPDSAGVTEKNASDTIVMPYNDLAALEDLFKKEASQIAAVITEPVPCNMGLILPEEGYLSGLRELCSRYDVLLIFDEVINGFRLARGGAQEYYGVDADITAMGKIIGGGLPVGAYGGSATLMNNIAPDGAVYQAGTLSGNPLAMAAGIEVLKKCSAPGFYEDLKRKASLFAEELAPALEKYKGKVMLQQLESIFSIYFTDREIITSVDQVKECDMQAFGRFHRAMLDRGIYLSPSGYEVGFISSAHSDEDIRTAAKAASESIDVALG